MADQEQGQYDRVNAAMIQNGAATGKIVSVVGSCQAFDGQHLTLQCADGGSVQILMQDVPNFNFEQGFSIEIVGTMEEQFQAYVVRPLGNDFDLELYNDLITKIMGPESHGRYNELFVPK